MKPHALKQTEAAQQLGISANRLNEIILGKRAITLQVAIRARKRLGRARTQVGRRERKRVSSRTTVSAP